MRGDVQDLAALDRGDGRPRRGHPPRVQPRHRPAVTEPDDRLRRGHAAHPPRRRGDARQPASRRSSTPPAAASTATSASSRRTRTTARCVPVSTYGASKLAGEALIASLRLHVRPARLRRSASATWSARARRTASASTSCAGCSPTRPRLRILGDGTPEQVVRPRRATWSRAVLLRRRAGDAPFEAFNVATGDYITVTEIADLAVECVGLDPARVDVRVHRRRPRLEGRRADRPPRHRHASAPSAGAARARSRRGAAAVDASRCSPTPRPGGSGDREPPAGRLPRPRRRAQRRPTVVDGVPHPPPTVDDVRAPARRGGGVPRAARRRAACWSSSRTSPTSPAAPTTARRSTRSTTSCAARLPPRRHRASARTTTPTTARAASRGPGCCSTAAARSRDRPRPQRHGRRPLARHRSRPGGRSARPSSSTTVTTSAGPIAPDLVVGELAEAVPFILETAREERIACDVSHDAADLHGQDLRRRRRPRVGIAGLAAEPADPGLHDQPDADAPGGRHRLRALRPRDARGRRRPADLVRGVLRRLRRDGDARRCRSPRGATTSTSRSR